MNSTAAPAPSRRDCLRGLAAAGLGLAPAAAAFAQTVDEFGRSALRGAGSTFVHPLMAAWAQAYRVARTGGFGIPAAGGGLDDEVGGVALDYEAVGSMAGITRVKAGAVDFAASEMPVGKAELDRDGLFQVPLVAGAVAVAANLEGPAGRELRLSAPLLADIYLGRVKSWSDPAIVQLNPGLALPAAPIAVLHRADGSGTTFTFTRFLGQGSSDWQSRVGSDLLVNWPIGEGHRGSAALARALERTPNAITFLSQPQLPPRLLAARVGTATGQFVAPTPATVQAAVAAARWDAATGFATLPVNVAASDAYPIVATVFGLGNQRSSGYRRRLTRAFFAWALTQGREPALRLGFAPLPAEVVQRVLGVLR